MDLFFVRSDQMGDSSTLYNSKMRIPYLCSVRLFEVNEQNAHSFVGMHSGVGFAVCRYRSPLHGEIILSSRHKNRKKTAKRSV